MEDNPRNIMNRFRRENKGVDDKLDMDGTPIDPAELEIEVEDCTFNDNTDEDIKEDYQFIRKRLRWAIAASEKVFTLAMRDMLSDPSPRVVEGCSAILKTVTDCTDQLFKLHGNYRKIPVKQPEPTPGEEGDEKKPTLKATVNSIIESFQHEEDDSDE